MSDLESFTASSSSSLSSSSIYFPVVDLRNFDCAECLSLSGLCCCLRRDAETQRNASELRRALTSSGFFHLVGHDNSFVESLNRSFEASSHFFSQPLEEKLKAVSKDKARRKIIHGLLCSKLLRIVLYSFVPANFLAPSKSFSFLTIYLISIFYVCIKGGYSSTNSENFASLIGRVGEANDSVEKFRVGSFRSFGTGEHDDENGDGDEKYYSTKEAKSFFYPNNFDSSGSKVLEEPFRLYYKQVTC